MYLFLFILWLIFNGHITTEIVITGLVIDVLLGLMCFVLFSYTPKQDIHVLKKLPLLLVYLVTLIIEIVKANLSVMFAIINKDKKLEPCLVTFDAGLKTDIGRFLLANSITLTPGTITISIEGNLFTVHCLTRSMLDMSEDNVFLKLLRKLEA